MILYKTGDLFTEATEALVNPVNCVGIMGRGLALKFKKRFPSNFHEYAVACQRREITLGRMHVFEIGKQENPRYIVNFPTKHHWKDQSQISDIELGLQDLAKVIRDREIKSIALPALGCGLGGLNWLDVKPLIKNAFGDFEAVDIVVYEPTRVEGVAG